MNNYREKQIPAIRYVKGKSSWIDKIKEKEREILFSMKRKKISKFSFPSRKSVGSGISFTIENCSNGTRGGEEREHNGRPRVETTVFRQSVGSRLPSPRQGSAASRPRFPPVACVHRRDSLRANLRPLLGEPEGLNGFSRRRSRKTRKRTLPAFSLSLF